MRVVLFLRRVTGRAADLRQDSPFCPEPRLLGGTPEYSIRRRVI